MSIETFIPKLWAASLETPFKEALIFTQPGIADTRFQPALAGGGKSVSINTIGAAKIKTHVRTEDLVYDDIDTVETELVMDKEEYYGFRVNDVDEVQAAGDFQGAATAEHGHAMAAAIDKAIAEKLVAEAGIKLATAKIFDGADYTTPAAGSVTAWDALRDVAKQLDIAKVPAGSRWVVVGPNVASALLADRRVTSVDAAGTDVVARNGLVAALPILGLNIYQSVNVPTSGKKEAIIAGANGSLAFATQLRTMEAFRDPARFGDIVRGLQVYGSKVIRPSAVAVANVEIAAGTAPGAAAA